jgi:hypothetical protein
MLILPHHNLSCAAPRVIRSLSLEITVVPTKVQRLSLPGALSKLAESSGKAVHGQGGPIKQVASIPTSLASQQCLRFHEATTANLPHLHSKDGTSQSA